MFIVFPKSHLTSTSLLIPLSYSLSFDIYHNLPHIFPHLLLSLATNNFLSPTPLSFTFLHVLLLIYHDATGLFLLSILHPLAHILFPPSTLNFFYLLLLSPQYFYSHFFHLLYYSNYFFVLTLSYFYFF